MNLEALKKFVASNYTNKQQVEMKRYCAKNLINFCEFCKFIGDCESINVFYPEYKGKKQGYFYLQDLDVKNGKLS